MFWLLQLSAGRVLVFCFFLDHRSFSAGRGRASTHCFLFIYFILFHLPFSSYLIFGASTVVIENSYVYLWDFVYIFISLHILSRSSSIPVHLYWRSKVESLSFYWHHVCLYVSVSFCLFMVLGFSFIVLFFLPFFGGDFRWKVRGLWANRFTVYSNCKSSKPKMSDWKPKIGHLPASYPNSPILLNR